MLNHLIQIIEYIIESFIHIWPYLLITIPIAVAVKMSGASRYIERAFTARPILAIFLATAVGAFSPLCSCSVIPVVAALLIGGVPLAPVMSFWLASPSMDPEIFFLTVSTLGWELAVWRMVATLVLSLGGGLITHFLVLRNLLGEKILQDVRTTQVKTLRGAIFDVWSVIAEKVRLFLVANRRAKVAVDARIYAAELPAQKFDQPKMVVGSPARSGSITSIPTTLEASTCSCGPQPELADTEALPEPSDAADCLCPIEPQPAQTAENPRSNFWKRLLNETWSATTMVVKFMLLAWFVGALIRLYVPETWITSTLGGENSWAILTAALLGIPIYTSNLTAMPLVGGLLAQGMHPGAALAFLIAGPTTTLPAMSAVFGIVNRRVFGLYIGFSLVGAVIFGYIFNLFT